MAHFAQIVDNKVLNVIVIDNSILIDENGIENEELGIQFCKLLINDDISKWVQTSYNSKFRNTFASINYIYDDSFDIFIEPKPNDNYIFDVNTLKWREFNG